METLPHSGSVAPKRSMSLYGATNQHHHGYSSNLPTHQNNIDVDSQSPMMILDGPWRSSMAHIGDMNIAVMPTMLPPAMSNAPWSFSGASNVSHAMHHAGLQFSPVSQDFGNISATSPTQSLQHFQQKHYAGSSNATLADSSPFIQTPYSDPNRSPSLDTSSGSSVTTGVIPKSLCGSPCELGDQCDRAGKCDMGEGCDGNPCGIDEACTLDEVCGIGEPCDGSNCNQEIKCTDQTCATYTCEEAKAAATLVYGLQSKGSQQTEAQQQQVPRQPHSNQQLSQYQSFGNTEESMEFQLRHGLPHHQQQHQQQQQQTSLHDTHDFARLNLHTNYHPSSQQPHDIIQHLFEYHRDPTNPSCEGPCLVKQPGDFLLCPLSCITDHTQLPQYLPDGSMSQQFCDNMISGLDNIPESIKYCHGSGYNSVEELSIHMHNQHSLLLRQLPQALGLSFNTSAHAQDEQLQEEYNSQFSADMSAYVPFSSISSTATTAATTDAGQKINNTPSTVESVVPKAQPNSPQFTLQSTPTTAESAAAEVSDPAVSGGENRCLWLDTSGFPCNNLFDNAKDLNQHVVEHHLKGLDKPEGGFQCRWLGCRRQQEGKCGFPQKSKIERHVQTHTGDKPFSCPECDKTFSAKQALDQHVLIHSNEKPLKCNFPGCTKTFRQQSARTMHMRVHTKERPLQCQYCGRRFSESSNLAKHRRTHMKEGSYQCTHPGCGKTFHRQDQLRRHRKTHEPKACKADPHDICQVESMDFTTVYDV